MSTPIDPESDAALLAAARTGDAAAFRRFAERYEKRLYGFLLRAVGDAQTAQDLAQEVFLRLLRQMREPGFAVEGDGMRAWLFTVATNLVRNEARKRRPAALADAGGLSEAALAARAVAPPRDLAGLRRRLDALIQELPDAERIAVILHDVEGLTYDATARAMDCSAKTARRHVDAARRKLTERVLGEGWLDGDATQ